MEENELFEDLHVDNDQTDDVPNKPVKVRKTAADFFRPIQVSSEVVKQTMGIDTDHITPKLLLAASRKVLGIARGEQQSDDRDSLEYQRVYGSAEYIPEHIQKDGGKVARNILWKATNRGNLDFLSAGALEPHVDSVFNESKLAQYIDGANMFESLDANTKVTRIGEGGVGDQRMAPDEMRSIHNSFLGFIDPARHPESLRIGLDSYMSKNTRKGSDGKLYTRMTDARTGEERWVDSVTLARSNVATAEYAPGGKYSDDKFVPIPRSTKGIVSYVPRNKIDFYSTRPDEMFSLAANSIPYVSGIKEMRAMLGSKHFASTVPLDNPETPWVSVVDPDTGGSIEAKLGGMMGTRRASKPGVVTAVRKDRIDVQYKDGTKESFELYQDYPNNQKGFINSVPLVKAGEQFNPGKVLARTNFTNDKGEMTNGVNLRTAFVSWNGLNYEDAKVISDYAAKKLASTTMYKSALDLDKSIKLGKANYLGMRPGEYSKEQMDNISDNGLVKVGTTVHKGDPLYVGVRSVPPSPGSFGKRQFEDITETWDHDHPGVVTDVVQTKKGLKVFVKSSAPVEEGDKLSNFAGMKGVVAAIIPRDKMPKDENGEPIDVLESPLGIISRTNSAFSTVMLLSEVARKRKQPYYVENFPKEDINEFALNEAKKYNVSPTRTLTDPETGRKIKNVQVGSMFVYKQKHMSEGKESARGTSGYNAEDIPSRGGYEGCLHGSTLVTTEDGKVPIRDIVKGKLTPRVLSYNVKKGAWEYNKVTDWFAYKVSTTRLQKYELEGDIYTLYATGNHEVYDNFGEKTMIQDYEIGDRIAVHAWDTHKHVIPSRKLARVSAVPTTRDYVIVYDITVENVHNYVANNILVSNSKRIGNMETAALASHGCFMGSVNVLTDKGYLEISKIVSKRIPCNVYTMLPDGSFGWRPVTDWFVYSVDSSELWKIETTARSGLGLTDKEMDIRKTIRSSHMAIRCTKDHKFYTPSGKVQAQDLKPGDLVYNPGIELTEWQMAMLRGCLMGDGCCVSPRTRPTEAPIFTVTHGYDQSAYIDWMYDKLTNVVYNPPKFRKLSENSFAKRPTKKLQAFNCYQITQLNKEFYCNDPDRKKRPPVGIIESMGWPGIGIWYADDGSITRSNSRYVSAAVNFHTCGFTREDCETLKDELIAFTGLPWRILMKSGKYPIITLSRGPRGNTEKYLDRFAQMISPYLPKMFAYKLEGLDYDKSTLGVYWDDKIAPPRIAKAEPAYIIKSEPYTPAEHENNLVYDITVEDTHNFIVHGVVVSNSWDVLKDAKLVRGQANQEFWRTIRTGEIPSMPREPIVYQKFYNHLKASGVNIKRTDTGLKVFALTDKEAHNLTGARELNSTDTFDANDYTPIKGGMFGSDIFGPEGDQWGYIKLDEPLPNPVMEEPLRRILKITQKDFEAIIAGEQTLNGMTGGKAIQSALSKINLKQELADAKQEFKTSSKSKKDEALKRYTELARMDKQGTHPSDFMLTRIPVLPAKYRPVMSSGGLTMVSDSNYLYKQMLEARDDLRSVKDLPDEVQGEARKGIYKAWKELTGMMEPSSPKLKQKAVKGLLRWALGISPKTSAVMQKLLTSTVDTVGRGVIAPDPSLKLDEIGLPKSVAFSVYKPFVTRALVNMNYTPLEAMKQVEKQTPVATDVLVKVMEKRPVIFNRAPTLHKFSMMGHKPKITAGHIIRVNPSIVGPYAADFDGNCLDYDSEIFVKISKSSLDKIGFMDYISGNQKMKEVIMKFDPSTDVRIRKDEVVYPCKIGEFPHIADNYRIDKNGAYVYEVPEGMEVLTIDPVTGESRYDKVNGFTHEKGCSVAEISVLHRKVIASDNESLAVFDHKNGGLRKVSPLDPEVSDCYIPVLKGDPRPFGTYGDRDLGWWIGAFISDGWESGSYIGYTKIEESKRNDFVRIARRICDNFVFHTYTGKASKNKLGDSVKVHLSGKDLVDVVRGFGLYDEDRNDSERASLHKMIPDWAIWHGSEEFLYGLLSGLLDGDGSIVKNTALTKPRFSCRYNTSSKSLRDSFEKLLYRMGIRFSTTVTPPRGWSKESYVISPSTVDMCKILDKLTCIGSREVSLLNEWIDNKTDVDKNDLIPITDAEWAKFRTLVSAKDYHTCINAKNPKALGRGKLINLQDKYKKEIPTLFNRAMQLNTLWAKPSKVEKLEGTRDVFDLLVEDTKVFVANNGIVVYDTANIHVPVSDAAVREVYEKMLPQRNLLSVRKNTIQYPLEKEYRQGIYLASRMRSNKAERTVDSLTEAIRMYNNNEIDIDTPIEIRRK